MSSFPPADAPPPQEGPLAWFRRRLAFRPAAEAEGELMPAPTQADIRRAVPAGAAAPGRAAARTEVNALLL